MLNKRYIKDGEVFSIGRGMFRCHIADGRYWVKGETCSDCCFYRNKPNGACKQLYCYPQDRDDNNDVVFERI